MSGEFFEKQEPWELIRGHRAVKNSLDKKDIEFDKVITGLFIRLRTPG